MAGRLAALPGERPTMTDWAEHLTTVFTDVRLKRYLEMRGADVGLPAQILAVAALWTGLFYDPAALDRANELARSIPLAELPALRVSAARHGLSDPRLLTLARQMVEIARMGLEARGRLDDEGSDERIYLQCLDHALETGLSPAHRLADAFQTEWNGRIAPVFRSNRY